MKLLSEDASHVSLENLAGVLQWNREVQLRENVPE